jgi:hypothetical protein
MEMLIEFTYLPKATQLIRRPRKNPGFLTAKSEPLATMLYAEMV